MGRFLCIIMLLLAGTAKAQFNIDHGIWGRIQSKQAYIYGDTVIVRSAPDQRSNPQDTAYLGDYLEIIEVNYNSHEAKGIYAPWYKVNYGKTGIKKEGYIWSPLVALNAVNSNGNRFLLGLERITKKDTLIQGSKVQRTYHHVRMKVFGKGRRLDMATITVENPWYLSTMLEKREGPSGLKKVEDIISFTLSSEVSGMPSFTYPYAWTGSKLIKLRMLNNAADADVVFHREKLIFPNDKGGEANNITWLMEEGMMTKKKDKYGKPVYDMRSDMKKYPWKPL